jgi:hypothetical protein
LLLHTALLKKNVTVLRRQRIATAIRFLSGMIVVLVITLVNRSWMTTLGSSLTFFKDLPDPDRQVVHGIPSCGETCTVFSYAPAPSDGFQPKIDFPTLAHFVAAHPHACPSSCTEDKCNSVNCKSCCSLHRIHKVVRGIMQNNGTGAGDRFPIKHAQVMGFNNESALNADIWDSPGVVQGSYIFSSPDIHTVTFTVQQNLSNAVFVRRVKRDPYKTITLPMQVAAEREIARQVFLNDDAIEFEVATNEYPHPQKKTSSLEGEVAPSFILLVLFIPMLVQVQFFVFDPPLPCVSV